jgi:hypothetical protein
VKIWKRIHKWYSKIHRKVSLTLHCPHCFLSNDAPRPMFNAIFHAQYVYSQS